jgi:hypothetical protein
MAGRQRTSKSLAASTATPDAAAKHMLFCPPGLECDGMLELYDFNPDRLKVLTLFYKNRIKST